MCSVDILIRGLDQFPLEAAGALSNALWKHWKSPGVVSTLLGDAGQKARRMRFRHGGDSIHVTLDVACPRLTLPAESAISADILFGDTRCEIPLFPGANGLDRRLRRLLVSTGASYDFRAVSDCALRVSPSQLLLTLAPGDPIADSERPRARASTRIARVAADGLVGVVGDLSLPSSVRSTRAFWDSVAYVGGGPDAMLETLLREQLGLAFNARAEVCASDDGIHLLLGGWILDEDGGPDLTEELIGFALQHFAALNDLEYDSE